MVVVGVHGYHRVQPLGPHTFQRGADPSAVRRFSVPIADLIRPGREKKPSVITADVPSSINSVVTPER